MKRLRRILAWLLLTLLVVVGLLWWRHARDADALTRTLLAAFESASGLQLRTEQAARVEFWPRIAIAIDRAQLHAPGGERSLADVHEFAIALPWSSLWRDEHRIEALQFGQLEIDVDAIAQWLATRSEAGPPQPLHWPQLDAELRIGELRLRDRPDLRLQALELGRIHKDAVTHFSAIWPASVPAARPELRMKLAARLLESSGGLALADLELDLHEADIEAATVRGALTWFDPMRQSAELELRAGTLPAWIDTSPLRFDRKPLRLQLRANGAVLGPLAVQIDGELAGDALKGEVQLPQGWTSLLAAPMQLAEAAHGELRIARLRTDQVEIDGFTWRNPAATR